MQPAAAPRALRALAALSAIAAAAPDGVEVPPPIVELDVSRVLEIVEATTELQVQC